MNAQRSGSPDEPGRREISSHCADVVLRLFEYVDNETIDADSTVIKAHLDQCGSCLREYERDIILKALIRRACCREPAPEALRSQIMARITQATTSTDGDVTQVTQISVMRRTIDGH